MESLFWTLCLAAVITAGFRLALGWGRQEELPQWDLVVLTRNSAQSIEGVIRTYQKLARLEGKDFRLYIIDGGSVDETLMIVDKFKQKGLQVEVIDQADLAESFAGAVDHLYGHIPGAERSNQAKPAQRERVREIRMVDMRRQEA